MSLPPALSVLMKVTFQSSFPSLGNHPSLRCARDRFEIFFLPRFHFRSYLERTLPSYQAPGKIEICSLPSGRCVSLFNVSHPPQSRRLGARDPDKDAFPPTPIPFPRDVSILLSLPQPPTFLSVISLRWLLIVGSGPPIRGPPLFVDCALGLYAAALNTIFCM